METSTWTNRRKREIRGIYEQLLFWPSFFVCRIAVVVVVVVLFVTAVAVDVVVGVGFFIG